MSTGKSPPKTNVAGRLSTETPYISELLQDIRSGEIKVPKFQRQFVWKEEQALKLLDSVAHSYPIGSLLLWKTPNKLMSERNIGDFRLPETDDLTPTDYVLDGQQRLTVIYSCLGADPDDEGFTAGYDLKKECFVSLDTNQPVHVFPLRILYNTTRLLDFRTALKSQAKDVEDLQSSLDSIVEAFSKYKIPTVTLKDLSVDEVCPIFERINSSGTRLSTYDLMVAATWSTKFDLNDEAREISASLDPKGFGDIDGNTVIKCLSGLQFESIQKEELLELRSLSLEEMNKLVDRTKKALLKSVDLLVTEFGIYSWDFLPYEALLIVTTHLLDKVGSLNGDQITRLRQWFWRASFGERYRGASENFITKDIKLVQEFVVSGQHAFTVFGQVPSADILKSVEFRSNNSRSRAFILALAARNPHNLTNGVKIDTADALSIFNKKQFHHIFPKAFLKRIKNKAGGDNSLANICMLAASENNLISDEDPAVYIPESAASLSDKAKSVFASNFIPEGDYKTLSFASFLDKRAALLTGAITRLCEGHTL